MVMSFGGNEIGRVAREAITFDYAVAHLQSLLASAREAAEEWLGFTGLGDVADHAVDQLNLQQLKFLELARALATEPKLLLLDEVLAGLNPSEIEASVGMIRRIHDQGITILIVEHVLRAVMSLSDRIVVLDQGQVIAEGEPEAVMIDEAVVAAYLGGKKI